MRHVWAFAALIAALFLPDLAAAHGGGLDTYGCHRNKKAGGYHCHHGPYKGMEFSSKEEALRFFEGGSGASSSDQAPATPLYTAPATPSQPSGSLDATADKLRIKSAQRMLKALGYYTGPVDGAMGAKTKTAVIAFQKVSGLPADGKVTDQLLDRLTAEVASAQ